MIQRYTGKGVSAEWMLPKVLWLKENEPGTYGKCTAVLEYGEWLLCQMTGAVALSANTARSSRIPLGALIPVRAGIEWCRCHRAVCMARRR